MEVLATFLVIVGVVVTVTAIRLILVGWGYSPFYTRLISQGGVWPYYKKQPRLKPKNRRLIIQGILMFLLGMVPFGIGIMWALRIAGS